MQLHWPSTMLLNMKRNKRPEWGSSRLYWIRSKCGKYGVLSHVQHDAPPVVGLWKDIQKILGQPAKEILTERFGLSDLLLGLGKKK